jgi:hypothetical protein
LLNLRSGCSTFATEQAQNSQRIDTQNPPTQQGNDDGSDANATPAKYAAPTPTATVPTILNVV